MDDFTRYLNKKLEDPGFRKEWDASASEYQAIRVAIGAQLEAEAKEKQLSENSQL